MYKCSDLVDLTLISNVVCSISYTSSYDMLLQRCYSSSIIPFMVDGALSDTHLISIITNLLNKINWRRNADMFRDSKSSRVRSCVIYALGDQCAQFIQLNIKW